jgi:hypothetical protein
MSEACLQPDEEKRFGEPEQVHARPGELAPDEMNNRHQINGTTTRLSKEAQRFGCGKPTHRIDFEVPRVSRTVQIDTNFLKWNAELIQSNVGSVSIGTAMEGVQSDLGFRHDDCSDT